MPDRPMTSTNADVVTAIAEAVSARDLDALMPHLDEEIEHRDGRHAIVGRGREAIREYFVELWSESPAASFTVADVVSEGDWVIVRQDWRGLAGGDRTTWVARRFRAGKVTRIEVCSTRAEALEAVAG